MYEIVSEPESSAVGITAVGGWRQEDQAQVVAFLEARLAAEEHLGVLFDLGVISREEAGDVLAGFDLPVAHRDGIARVAVVGDEFWERARDRLAAGLPRAELQFFRPARLAEAWAWVRGRV